MIFMGRPEFIVDDSIKIYNVSYPIDLYEHLDLLPKFNTLSSSILLYETLEEETMNICINHLLNTKIGFFSLIKLMIEIYDGYDVYLLVDNQNSYIDFFNEAIKNIIEDRYGYPIISINDFEDYNYIIKDPNFYTMSKRGLEQFDMDKDYYYYEKAKIEGVKSVIQT